MNPSWFEHKFWQNGGAHRQMGQSAPLKKAVNPTTLNAKKCKIKQGKSF